MDSIEPNSTPITKTGTEQQALSFSGRTWPAAGGQGSFDRLRGQWQVGSIWLAHRFEYHRFAAMSPPHRS